MSFYWEDEVERRWQEAEYSFWEPLYGDGLARDYRRADEETRNAIEEGILELMREERARQEEEDSERLEEEELHSRSERLR